MTRLQTLGRFELRSEGPQLGSLLSPQPKRQALLTYLALATPRGFHRRDALLALFWPEASQDEARNALRQSLHYLRHLLGDDVLETRADDQVGLVESALWCDAVELEKAAAGADHARAVELYQGPFLDAVFVRGVSPDFQEWVDRTRARLRTIAADAAAALSSEFASAGRGAEAIAAARRRCEIDPESEDALRSLLILLENQGRRAEALAEADRFAAQLRERYELEPSRETEALVGRIRAGRGGAPQAVAPAVDLPVPEELDIPTPPPLPAFVRPRRVGAMLGTVTLVTLAALGILLWRREPPPAPSSPVATARRVIVVDFTDRASSAGLGGLVANAMRVDLSQSTALRVVSSAQMRAALQRMDRPIDQVIDDSVALDMAVREGVSALVTGEVHAVGATIVLTAQVVAIPGGDQLAAARETARDSTDVVPAIERLSRSLRHRSGESLAQVAQSVPLSRATTGSLDALRKYTEGLQLIDRGARTEGIAQLQQAVAIDPGFATAWRMLGSTYGVLGEPARAAVALQQAFDHAARLPYRERYLVMGSYYRNATGQYDKAVAAYRALLALYPDDLAATNNLGLTLTSLGRHAAAESLYRRVLARDSGLVNVWLVLAEALASQGRLPEGRAMLAEAGRRFPDHPVVGLTRIYIEAAARDWPAALRFAEQRLATVTASAQRIDALQTLGQVEMLTGRAEEARAHLEESRRLARAEDSPRKFWWSSIVLGWLELHHRERAGEAQRRIQEAQRAFPLERLSADDVPVTALASLVAALGAREELRRLMKYVGDTVDHPVAAGEMQFVAGLLALEEGRAADAEALVEASVQRSWDCPICYVPDLMRIRLALGDTSGAIAAGTRYVETPFIQRFEPDAAHLSRVTTLLAKLNESKR